MNKFDQHIKNKLTEQQAPPFDAWKNIESKLDETKKRRIIPFIFWLSSSAACIGIFTFMYFNNKEEKIQLKQQIVSSKNIEKSSQRSISKSDELEHSTLKNSDINNFINIVNKEDKHFKSNSYKNNLDHSILKNSVIDYTDSNASINFYIDNHLNKIKESTDNQHSDLDSQNNIDYLAINQKDIQQNISNEKSIEEILNEKEKSVNVESIEIEPKTKFSVSTFVSPTMFLKDESILSQSFDTHEISNKISLSYGAKIAYQVNDKLKIRSGISKLDFDQNTKDIVTARISTNGISTIEPLSSAVKLSNNNIRYNSNVQVLSNHEAYPITFYTSQENTMNQKVEFLEIPLEIEYNLLQKSKFNFSLIGGGSYMILTKNDIFIDNNIYGRSKLGKAENLNDFSYSVNAGLKFEYFISEKAGINLEPNYKFLLNPLKDLSNKDNSLLGIGLGFSYKF